MSDMHRGRRIAARAGRPWHEVTALRVGHQASSARQVLQKDGGKDIVRIWTI